MYVRFLEEVCALILVVSTEGGGGGKRRGEGAQLTELDCIQGGDVAAERLHREHGDLVTDITRSAPHSASVDRSS